MRLHIDQGVGCVLGFGVSGASIHAAAKFGMRDYSQSNPPSLARRLTTPVGELREAGRLEGEAQARDAVEHGTRTLAILLVEA